MLSRNPRLAAFLVLIAVGIGVVAAVLVAGENPLALLAQFPWWAVPLGLAMIFVGWNINALRYRILLGAQGVQTRHGANLGLVMATEFGYVATPFGSGGPATFLWLNARRGVSASTSGGVFALDQLTDLVFFLSVLPLLLIGLIGLPGRFHWGGEMAAMAVLLVLTIVTVVLAIRHYRPTLRGASGVLDGLRFSGRWRARVTRGFLRFRLAVMAGLNLSPRRLAVLYGLCALHWLLRYGVLFMLVLALNQTASFSYVFFVQLVTMGIGQVSALPGGAGAVELSFGVLLSPLVPAATLGVLLLGWRLVTFYWYLLAGGAVFAFHLLRVRRAAR